MMSIAKVISKRDMALMISAEHLEAVPAKEFPRKEVLEYERFLHKNHEDKDPAYRLILKKGRLPIISQMQLGEGDLGLPLMAAIAAYLTYPSYFIALAVIIGSTVGLLWTIRSFKKYLHPMPTIPPLFALICISSGIALVFTGNVTAYNPYLLIFIGFAVGIFGIMLRHVQHKEKPLVEGVAIHQGLLWRIP
jgi:predicted tellurium resistance membrane protein TerC